MSSTGKYSFSKRETFYFHNSLLCLVKALEKRYTTIDLRNEISVTGKIEEVDGFMNLVLSDAAIFDTDGEFRYFPLLHVQSRNIRYVHIPDNVSIKKAIKDQLLEENKPVNKKLTFKQSRAMKKHKETLKLIAELKEKKNTKTEKEND